MLPPIFDDDDEDGATGGARLRTGPEGSGPGSSSSSRSVAAGPAAVEVRMVHDGLCACSDCRPCQHVRLPGSVDGLCMWCEVFCMDEVREREREEHERKRCERERLARGMRGMAWLGERPRVPSPSEEAVVAGDSIEEVD